MASEIKPIAGLDRTILSEVVPLDTPFTLFIFPTTYCNFKCNYCGHSLGHAEMKKKYGFIPEHMSMDTFEKVIQQAKQFPKKLKMISLTGHGEPLLNKNLPEMIKKIKEADICERVEIISNASLLFPDVTDKLIAAGLDTLRISLQGLSSQKYEEICKYKTCFDDYINNIKYFYEHKGDCNLFIKIMDIALEEGEDEKFYNLFRDISDRMYIEQCRPVYDGVEMTKGMQVVADRYGRKHDKREVCPLCFYMLGIFPNGDVEPCDTIYKPITLGNVNDKSLSEIWNSKELREFRIMHLNKQRSNNKSCKVCCAMDDVAHPEDNLDGSITEVLSRI